MSDQICKRCSVLSPVSSGLTFYDISAKSVNTVLLKDKMNIPCLSSTGTTFEGGFIGVAPILQNTLPVDREMSYKISSSGTGV